MSFACLFAWLLSPALAQPSLDLAIVGMHDSESLEAQQATVAALTAAAQADPRIEAHDDADVAQRIRGREDIVLEQGFLGPGRRLLQEGRTLFEQASFDDAVGALNQAIDSLRAGAPSANAVPDLWEAFMLLGTAQFASDRSEEATRAWAEAIALNPLRRPDPNRFPPDVVAAYDSTRQTQMAGVGKLSFDVQNRFDGGVSVSLDGVSIGDAPGAVASNVPPGEHLVLGRAPDGARAFIRVQVAAGSDAWVTLVMEPPTLRGSSATTYARSRQAAALYRALGEHAQVDLVLLAGEVDGKLQLQLYSVGADTFSAPVVVDGSLPQALTAALAAVADDGSIPASAMSGSAIPLDLQTNRILAERLLNPTTAAETEPPPKTKKRGLVTWAVVSAASAAVLGTGGIVLATLPDQNPNQGTIIVGPAP